MMKSDELSPEELEKDFQEVRRRYSERLPYFNPKGKLTGKDWAMAGPREVKRARWAEWQRLLDQAHGENPDLGIYRLRRLVARRLGISDRTLRLHTHTPF